MIFSRDYVTRENHCQIASFVTQKSLYMVTHALFYILFYIWQLTNMYIYLYANYSVWLYTIEQLKSQKSTAASLIYCWAEYLFTYKFAWCLFFHKHTYVRARLCFQWINNYIHYKMWDEIIYPCPNFNGAAFEVWEWIGNFMPHFTVYVIS